MESFGNVGSCVEGFWPHWWEVSILTNLGLTVPEKTVGLLASFRLSFNIFLLILFTHPGWGSSYPTVIVHIVRCVLRSFEMFVAWQILVNPMENEIKFWTHNHLDRGTYGCSGERVK